MPTEPMTGTQRMYSVLTVVICAAIVMIMADCAKHRGASYAAAPGFFPDDGPQDKEAKK